MQNIYQDTKELEQSKCADMLRKKRDKILLEISKTLQLLDILKGIRTKDFGDRSKNDKNWETIRGASSKTVKYKKIKDRLKLEVTC